MNRYLSIAPKPTAEEDKRKRRARDRMRRESARKAAEQEEPIPEELSEEFPQTIPEEDFREEDGTPVCFLCGRNGCADPLDKHHLFGGCDRKKSERYGAWVYLCHRRCHESGPHAAHRDPDVMRRLREYGQRKIMREQGWTTEDFIREFGRNYL